VTTILGISAFYHDSAAALIKDGEILAAAQEERFTRKKHDAGYPGNAVNYVLSETGLRLNDVDHIVFYDKPFLKFERLLETYLAYAPRGFLSFRHAMPEWIRKKLFQKKLLLTELRKHDNNFNDPDRLLFSEHHYSHAASAFFPSPFNDAVVLVLDGVGEWATTSVAIGHDRELEIVEEIHFPHSVGLLYAAFTYYLGFKVNSGEYKVMGLAPYGVPRFREKILEHLIDLKEDGTFRLDMTYFDYCTGLTMTNNRFAALFGNPARRPENDLLTQFHMDIAASIQAVTDEVMLRMSRSLYGKYNIPNLCLAGGVALNCVTNGKIIKDGKFANVWVQPAAGDAGGAIGAALAVWHTELKRARVIQQPDAMKGAYLGPAYSQDEIERRLDACGAVFETVPQAEMPGRTARALADGKVVGWFQGRMEFGPRALGARSILADPRSGNMQKILNLKIKHRESFRPFAPSVLSEDAGKWFEMDYDSPYMMFVAAVKKELRYDMTTEENELFGIDKLNIKRSAIPAVTHVDYSARIQTVHIATNAIYHSLINEFKKITGCPVMVNTSFNVRGEPIVCTPEDAFKCFMRTEMDYLAIGNSVVLKPGQNKEYKEKLSMESFELD